MTEKFLKQDPINENEFKNMSDFIYEEIKDTLKYIEKDRVKKIVGIGGTITSLSAINQEIRSHILWKKYIIVKLL